METPVRHSRMAPPVNKLCAELKDVDPDLAKEIRRVWKEKSNRLRARKEIDQLFGTFGVEYLGLSKTGKEVYYCNAGDTYAPTIGFVENRLVITTMADLDETLLHPNWA